MTLDLPAHWVYDDPEGDDTVTRDEILTIPFRDLLRALGMTQTECSRRFDIPLRTVQNWCASSPDAHREPPPYVKLMMAELAGIKDAEA